MTWKPGYKPRVYFINAPGVPRMSFAPLAEMIPMIDLYRQNPQLREVTFEEWMPVDWAQSDYTFPPPTEKSEVQYWNSEY